jgi:hypothetical protein
MHRVPQPVLHEIIAHLSPRGLEPRKQFVRRKADIAEQLRREVQRLKRLVWILNGGC